MEIWKQARENLWKGGRNGLCCTECIIFSPWTKAHTPQNQHQRQVTSMFAAERTQSERKKNDDNVNAFLGKELRCGGGEKNEFAIRYKYERITFETTFDGAAGFREPNAAALVATFQYKSNRNKGEQRCPSRTRSTHNPRPYVDRYCALTSVSRSTQYSIRRRGHG